MNTIENKKPRPIETPRDHVTGEVGAKVAIVEYGDYGCPDCRRLQSVLSKVRDDSGLPIKYVFRHLPLESQEPHRFTRAIAAEAAARQGKFWEMHKALFQFASESVEGIERAAVEAGLDMRRFELDCRDPAIAEEVAQDVEEAAAHGIDTVPALFIRGREYTGVWDVESLEHAIRPPLGIRVRNVTLEFAQWAASSSVVLIAATIVALLWRNSFLGASYEHFWHLDATVAAAGHSISMSLQHWVNDLLMAVFFLVVGLELKREFLEGELADPRRAALPVSAAVGGMVIPAAMYWVANRHTAAAAGWGIPMATDIAFTLGVLALAGRGVPVSLKVFVTALAIADDLGAILILAIAYNHGLSVAALSAAAGIMAILFGLNRARVYSLWPYLTLGLCLWVAVFFSGLHATLAGVLLAIVIPARRQPSLVPLLAQGAVTLSHSLRRLQADDGEETQERRRMAERLRVLNKRLRAPAEQLEHALQPWSSYFVLPLFALANAGLLLGSNAVQLGDTVLWGVLAGLVIGKPLGIFAATWLVVKLGWGQLPSGVTSRHLIGAGCLCGIGFTMSIFVANEAFDAPLILSRAKLAVVIASVVSALLGFAILRYSTTNNEPEAADQL